MAITQMPNWYLLKRLTVQQGGRHEIERRVLLFGVLILGIVSGGSSSLWAQTADTGALRGTVTDPSGGSVPGATVTLTSNATARTLTTTTGSEGTYTFSALPAATYTLKASSAGFSTTEVPSVIVNATEI